MVCGWAPLFYLVLNRWTPLFFSYFINEQVKPVNFLLCQWTFYTLLLQNINLEGLDIETEKSHLEQFIDKTFCRKCRLCCQLFIIAKNFKALFR